MKAIITFNINILLMYLLVNITTWANYEDILH